MLEDAKSFFKRYNGVFDSGNMEEFSRFFCEPFVSVRADMSVVSASTNEIAKTFFEKTYAQWKTEGYQYFSTKDYEVTPIGSNSMLVTLTWELLDQNRALIREWRQSYNLLKQDESWKVLASTFHS